MDTPFTILVISFFVALAMSGVLFIISRTYPKDIRGLAEWSTSVFVIALSLPLFIARGMIPDAFSIVMANLMVLIGFMIMNAGTRKFAGASPRIGLAGLLLFIFSFVLLLAWSTYVQPDIGMRIATLNAFTLIVILDLLLLTLKQLPGTTGRNILLFSLAILIGIRIVRLGGPMLGLDQPTGVFDTSISQLVFIAIPSITIPLGTIGLIMLASERLRQDLEFISRHDDLTQCLNKKSATEELQREIAHARRYGNKLSIMIVDLDNFKDINDIHGHLQGDQVLIDFSIKAKTHLRETDRLARFGGDEFMAILPDTDLEHALLVANRLHETGKESRPIAWSVSIGISQWLGDDDTLADFLTRADKALYKSKAMGRSQTQLP